jgi:hypothetical protein
MTKLEVGKKYRTELNHIAHVLFKQPEDVQDPYPFVGYVYINGPTSFGPKDFKMGVCWKEDGLCGTEMYCSIIGEAK